MQIALLPVDERHSTLHLLLQQYQAELRVIGEPQIADPSTQNGAQEPGAGSSSSFLILVDHQPIGCAIIGQHSRRPQVFPVHTISAFYVMPVYRRRGVGYAAATQLLNRFPGRWELATYGGNVPALAFWRSVADRYTLGHYTERWYQDSAWRGSIHSFASPSGLIE